MSRTAYFDLANGISGDMTLAALVHAGRRLDAPVEDAIVDVTSALGLGCAVSFVDDERGGVVCVHAEVKTDGARHSAGALREAVASAGAADRACERALASLDALIDAEAAVHGVGRDDVHLHELASADTAVDLLGAAVGLHVLGVRDVGSAHVPVPSGWISTEHGDLPLPAPVTLELLRGATLQGVASGEELVTPSGAAILVGHGATSGLMPALTLEAIGVGAGTRIGDRPNICRVLIGTRTGSGSGRLEECVLLETNIDDQTPEGVAHAAEQLLASGALDVWTTPIVMKRSRPAFQLSVLMRPGDEPRLTDALFRLTTTLGVRRLTTTRSTLDREELIVEVAGQPVRVKVGRLHGEAVNIAPEFGDCEAVAGSRGLALKDVFADATTRARAALDI